jgi:hypothetical protein
LRCKQLTDRICVIPPALRAPVITIMNSSGLRGTSALHLAIAVPRGSADAVRFSAPCAMTTPLLDLDGRVVDRRRELTELQAAV